MFIGMPGFIVGVILLYFLSETSNTSLYSIKKWALFLLLIQAAYLSFQYSLKRPSRLKYGTSFKSMIAVLGCLAGYIYAYDAAHALKSAVLKTQYENQTIYVTAYLCDIPVISEFGLSAEFCLMDVNSGTEALAGEGFKAVLRWPHEMELTEQVYRLSVQAKRPRASVNFLGASFESYLFYRGVVLSGKVRGVQQIRPLESLDILSQVSFRYHQLRLYLSRFCDRLLGGFTHEGMLKALLLGERSGLSVNDHKVLNTTGTQHLIAISGLHVGIVMLGLYAMLPRSFFCLAVITLTGAVYILLVGFSPSAQRAWVMCVLGIIYAAGFLRISRLRIYILALFIVLLIDPLAPLNPGFWFSFICVAILMLVTALQSFEGRVWYSVVFLQCWLILILAPVYSYLGLPFSAVNLLANLFAVPWISCLILPLALICFLLALIAEWLLQLVLPVLHFVDVCLSVMMAFLGSIRVLSQHWFLASSLIMAGCFLVSVLAVMIFGRLHRGYLMIMVTTLLMLILPGKLNAPREEMVIFDAGQGLAIAMNFQGRSWLYDTGPAYGKTSVVENAILPYLRVNQLISAVSGLIVSHGDADHAGGTGALLDLVSIPVLLSGEPERLRLNESFSLCQAGLLASTDMVSLEILYPFDDVLSETKRSANNHSCVVRFRLRGKTFLLMGDIEAEAELQLVKDYRHKLKADVLIAGHHGAAKATTYALLKHVQPELIVFSTGYLNSFGHPSDMVLSRLAVWNQRYSHNARARSVRILNTADVGAIRIQVDSDSAEILVNTARGQKTAFWYDHVRL